MFRIRPQTDDKDVCIGDHEQNSKYNFYFLAP